MNTESLWPEGTVGRVYSPHKSEGDINAKARLCHDSPPDQESVTVELLEDFYCCESGDEIEMQRYLFRPNESQKDHRQ